MLEEAEKSTALEASRATHASDPSARRGTDPPQSRQFSASNIINSGWIEDIIDEQAIADVYQRTTSSCQMSAQVKGSKDRQAADAVLFKEDMDEEQECTNKEEVPKTSLSMHRKSKELSFLQSFSSSKSTSTRRLSKVVDTINRTSNSCATLILL